MLLAAPASAYDFGAAAMVAALAVGGAALAVTFGAPAAIGTAVIGAVVAGIEFSAPDPATSTNEVEVQLSPAAKLATPDGWTAPATGQTEPTPPATVPAQTVTGWKFNDSMKYSTVEAACNAWCALYPRPVATCVLQANNSVSVTCNPGGSYALPYTESTCPSGYTASGSNCVLSNSSAVKKPADNRCTIKRTGNSFGVDSRDPDCASGKVPATTTVTPNIIEQTDANGAKKSIVIEADGSTTLTESRPNHSNNTTESNTTKLSAPDASGQVKVTGQGSGLTPGIGTLAGTGTAPFDKSGLATEGTLAGIKGDTGAIKDALNFADADSSLAGEKSAFDAAAAVLSGMFTSESTNTIGIEDDFSLSGFLPASCGCTPLTIDYHGHVATFDWCAPMETFKSALAWMLGLLTALYILTLFKVSSN